MYQDPDSVDISTNAAKTSSDRDGISHDSYSIGGAKGSAHDDRLIDDAFALSARGKNQANAAAARIASLVYNCTLRRDSLAMATSKYLAGMDLPTASGKKTAQTIIARLNGALDGHGQQVVKAIMTADEIARLRLFRLSVRAMLGN